MEGWKGWTGGRRFAYVSLLTKEAYLPGVQALARSLRVVGTTYPLIVLYTSGVTPGALEALRAEGCEVRYAEPFRPDSIDHSEYKRALYLECWNKLRMWEMTEYDRLVYLDADMVLCKNIDHLFGLPPAFHAVGDCYGGRETEQERDACCHFRPAEPPSYFNAGFYVMQPSRKEFAAMEAAVAQGCIPVRFFAEQDFLNGYFARRWRHLPYVYNAQKRIKRVACELACFPAYHHPELWRFDDLAVIHYVDEKPWSHRYSEENLQYREECDWWWAVYEGRMGGVGGVDVNSATTAASSSVRATPQLHSVRPTTADGVSGKRSPLALSHATSSAASLPLSRAGSGCAVLEQAGSLGVALPPVPAK